MQSLFPAVADLNFGPQSERWLWRSLQALSVTLVLCSGILLVRMTMPSFLAKTKWRIGDLHTAFRTAAACSAFMLVGPALMLLNKNIMQEVGFAYPLTLSSLGLCASAITAKVLVATGAVVIRPESKEVVAGAAWYRIALPIGAAKAITLATGNAVYLHLGLGFIQMLKAFTPAIVVAVLRVWGLPLPPKLGLWSVWVIVAGTCVEVKGELNATVLGVALMLISELMEATNLVLTQRLMQNSKFSLVEGMHTLGPPGCLFLWLAAAFMEWPQMLQRGHQRLVLEQPLQFLAAAALGLAVNFLSMMVVQATSSLTLKILNTARCVGLVFVGVLCYGEVLTVMEVCGYLTALLGFAGYNWSMMSTDANEKFERLVNRRCGKFTGSAPALTVDEFKDGKAMSP